MPNAARLDKDDRSVEQAFGNTQFFCNCLGKWKIINLFSVPAKLWTGLVSKLDAEGFVLEMATVARYGLGPNYRVCINRAG